jgi:pilus assembly protein CpaE
MKIAVISPNQVHLQEIRQVLEAGAHTVRAAEGGKSRMREVAEKDQPDLMLVDGMCCDPAELEQVEYVTSHHPKIAVILLCSQQSPEFLINAMRVGVREVLPSPPGVGALQAAVQRVAVKLRGSPVAKAGQVLAFMGGKGGSGATFIAANLGYLLAQSRSVLLIDLNLQSGDALSFVSEEQPASTVADVARDISRLDASFLAASTVKVAPNFSVLAAPEDMAQAMEVKPEQVEAIMALAVRHYDFVLLDLSRTLDTLTIKALDRADRIFMVMQAALPWVRHARQLQIVFKSLGYGPDKVEWILNRYEKASDIGMQDICRSLNVPKLRTVANAYKEVNASINYGTALLEVARSSAVTRNLSDFALSLSPQPAENNRGLMNRLFKRA